MTIMDCPILTAHIFMNIRTPGKDITLMEKLYIQSRQERGEELSHKQRPVLAGALSH